jgi:endoglucanase
MKNFLFSLLVLALADFALMADEATPTTAAATNQATTVPPPAVEESSAPQFQNGDRVCFLGDSITQRGVYGFNIMLYHATRFPDRKIEWYNCGRNGDSAGGVIIMKRYEWDVLSHQPTIVTIMLGMNDVGHPNYGKDKTGPEWDSKHKFALIGYDQNMHKVSDILTKAGCKLIYLTPSIYDQTGNQAKENHFGVNDALGVCAEDCRKLAAEYHAGLVDFYGPMLQINTEQQKKDASFTIVGPDRIHPETTGAMVMAYLFLKAQKVPADVSNMAVDATTSKVVKQDNCAITDIKPEKAGISFVAKENALPLPVIGDDLKKVEALVPFTHDLDQEMLTVANLPAGNYQVIIDGQPVQECTSDELKNGINLATNLNTPQYKQAAAVNDLCLQRRKLEELLRSYYGAGAAAFKANVSLDDEQAARKAVQDELDAARKINKAAPHLETFLKYTRAEWKKMEADAAALWDKVYTVNQPVPHTFEIRPK